MLGCGSGHQGTNAKMKTTLRLSDLSETQKQHLAWRLDRNTGYGLGSIGRVARGEAGDFMLTEIFEKFDMTPHQAKIHARKVTNFCALRLEK